ncbi:MAG: hypothetical protein QOG99_959, partial [Frankiales bacterium]|nr:hypothetical protein [Frankiales bacterium]
MPGATGTVAAGFVARFTGVALGAAFAGAGPGTWGAGGSAAA